MPRVRTIAIALIGCFGCLGLVVLAGGLVVGGTAWLLLRHYFIPESCSVELPGEHATLIYSRQGIHPFLAEYSRGVTISHDGVEGKYHPLMVDIGAGTPVNLYWIEDNGRQFLRLNDEMAEHLLDLAEDKMYLVARFDGFPMVAELTREDATSMRSVGGKPESAEFLVDDRPGFPLKKLTADDHGQYLGTIAGRTSELRFWKPDEIAEPAIRRDD